MRKKILAALSALAIALGVVAFSATAAEATHPVVEGTAMCNTTTGMYDITWKVTGDTSYPRETATVVSQSQVTQPTFVGLSVKGAGFVTAVQSGVDSGTHSLTVSVQWTNHREGNLVSATGRVTVSDMCQVKDATATISFTAPTCDTAQTLVLNTPVNATWSDPVYGKDGNGRTTFSVTATATDHHVFADGSATKSFTGTLLAATGDCGPKLAIAIYIYPLVDSSKPASWANSGSQTLIAHRPASSTSDWYTALPTLPTYVCGTAWGVQQDIARLSSTFTLDSFPPVVDRATRTGVLGWPPIVAAIHQPLSALVTSIPDCTPPAAPTVKHSFESCDTDSGQTSTQPGSITFAAGAWEWRDSDNKVVSGTQNFAQGTYTFTAIANPGVMFDNNGTTRMQFRVTVSLDKFTGPCLTKITPVTPTAVGQQCVAGDNSGDFTRTSGGINVELDTNLEYTITGTGGTIYGPKVATAAFTPLAPGDYSVTVAAVNGYELVAGAPTQWPLTVSAALCTVTPNDPYSVPETCSVFDEDSTISGHLWVDLEGNLANELEYRIQGNGVDFVATQEVNELPPGDYTVTATAKPGYTLGDHQTVWPLTIDAAGTCSLVTHPLISTTATTKNLTCATSGSYTLANTTGVLWYVDINGVQTLTQPGTYKVSNASTVKVHAELLDSTFGWEDDAQTDWTFNFTSPSGECLPTLAFTGSTGGPAGLLLAGGFLMIGGTIIAFERRFRVNAK